MERIGLKRQTPISLWETEGILPKPQTIEKIARALGCRTSELLEDVATPYDLLRKDQPLSADARARGPTGRRAVRNVRARSA